MSAKWPGLPAFLAHLAIGACLAMPVNTFVQYYFNGRLMAQLPQWDASIYSHAAIMPVYVLGEPITALVCTTEPLTVSDDGYLELKKPTTAIMATGVIANRIHVRWKWLEGTNDYDAGVWNTSAAAVIWSNYDLVDAAGNVYLKASEPVPRAPIPVLPEPDPDPERKPIAYKYNGVQLPDINTVWTDDVKKALPYAVINKMTYKDDIYWQVTLTNMLATGILESDGSRKQISFLGTFIYATLHCVNESMAAELGIAANEWVAGESGQASYNYFAESVYPTIWTNTDILTTDGIVYLAASEPVPVYEAKTTWYLYNGVKLPEKPDFPITSDPIPGQPDRTQEYQYQFIYQLTEETVVYSFIRNIGKTQAGTNIYGIGSGDVVEFKLEGDTWTLLHMATNDGLAYLDTIIWSNHDIPDADGNVYLAASEPVPVYE